MDEIVSKGISLAEKMFSLSDVQRDTITGRVKYSVSDNNTSAAQDTFREILALLSNEPPKDPSEMSRAFNFCLENHNLPLNEYDLKSYSAESALLMIAVYVLRSVPIRVEYTWPEWIAFRENYGPVILNRPASMSET